MAIARALAKRPKLLLADQPTGSLDAETGIPAVIRQICDAENMTLILVIHNAPVPAIAGIVVPMHSGTVTEVAKNPSPAPPALRLPVGMSIYMPIDDVRRAFRDCLDLPPSAINSVLIRAAKPFRRFLQNRLYSLPWAAAVTPLRDEKRDLEEELRFLYVFIDVLTAFGVSVALSVIYATVLVSTLERRRELASLRAEGLPFARVAILVTAENAIIWLLACAAGLPLGDRLARALLATYVTESLELTPVVYPRTFILAAAATLAAVLLSQLPALRYIRRLNLAAVLRYRD